MNRETVPDATSPQPPDEATLARLRRLFSPYVWLVFLPLLGLLTTFFGSLSVMLSFVSPAASEWCERTWARILCRIAWTRVAVVGRGNVAAGQSYVIMSNHQSHFDVLALAAHVGLRYKWVMKQELRKAPFLGAACYRAGHIFIDRSNREAAIASLEKARERLKGGTSVLFFPEGTRSRDGRLQSFKKGGFMMALDLGLPILPLSISGTHRILPGKTMQLLPGHARITIHAPIDTAGYSKETRDELIADVRAVISSALTERELPHP